jgi:hypothetical protein
MSAVRPPDYLSAEQIALFERLADRVVRRRLTVPAVLFLESVRPLNYIGSQAMVFFSPFVHALFDTRQYELIREALERRETLGYLCDVLEAQESIILDRERAEKAARKAAQQARKGNRGWFK